MNLRDEESVLNNQNILFVSKNALRGEISCQRYQSPLGSIFLAAFEERLCYLAFESKRTEWCSYLEKHYSCIIREVNNHPVLQEAEKTLDAYFSRQIERFNLPLIMAGTTFQHQVWRSLNQIPYGQTISYQEQSLRMNAPKAIRAIATANGANPISIIIPCHRVIGKRGALTGYGGGIDKKAGLLALESKIRLN